jgi:hypothetical protein
MARRPNQNGEHFRFLVSGDTIRVRYSHEHGRVVAFMVQLECWVEGDWKPVVRYDTAHGWPHRDTLDWAGHVVAKDPMPAGITYKDAMVRAERDLIANAAVYRAEFIRRKP